MGVLMANATELGDRSDGKIPDRTEVLVVGGGIVGASIAYHLTRRGITDVTVIEQGALTGGTTWHAAGLVSQLKSSHSLTKLATYSTRLFEELEEETGQATGSRPKSSIWIGPRNCFRSGTPMIWSERCTSPATE